MPSAVLALKDMRREITTFSGAGLDTTLWSISYTLPLLGDHPEVQEKLYQEIQAYLSNDDFDKLTTDKLKKLTYINTVFSESLYPPIPLVVRHAGQDISVGGRAIPE